MGKGAYSKYLIIYLDVLGFKEMIRNAEDDAKVKWHAPGMPPQRIPLLMLELKIV